MLAETNPGKFLIVFSVASTSMSTNLCWFSGSTVKTFISVTTSLSFEIVVIRLPFSLGVSILRRGDYKSVAAVSKSFTVQTCLTIPAAIAGVQRRGVATAMVLDYRKNTGRSRRGYDANESARSVINRRRRRSGFERRFPQSSNWSLGGASC